MYVCRPRTTFSSILAIVISDTFLHLLITALNLCIADVHFPWMIQLVYHQQKFQRIRRNWNQHQSSTKIAFFDVIILIIETTFTPFPRCIPSTTYDNSPLREMCSKWVCLNKSTLYLYLNYHKVQHQNLLKQCWYPNWIPLPGL